MIKLVFTNSTSLEVKILPFLHGFTKPPLDFTTSCRVNKCCIDVILNRSIISPKYNRVKTATEILSLVLNKMRIKDY